MLGSALRSVFQSSFPESACNATMMLPCTGRYMTSLMTIGGMGEPAAGARVAEVLPLASWLTLAGVIWVSGENFIPPGSFPTAGQSRGLKAVGAALAGAATFVGAAA